jgi:hypothetical protein
MLRSYESEKVKETAESIGVSVETVYREVQTAEAWLYRRLKSPSH